MSRRRGPPARTDIELAMRLMVEAALSQPRVINDPGPKVFLTTFAESSINLELGFWIADPEEGRGNVTSDVNLAIWRAFRANSIAIPFPQQDIHIRSVSPGVEQPFTGAIPPQPGAPRSA